MATLDNSRVGGQVQDEHIRETQNLISADKVEGTPVYNARGDRLGTVYDIMIDKRSGRVAYAVMSFGGFLGIGEKYHPLPWDALTYDPDKGGYNIDLTEDQLRRAPTFTADELADFGRNGDDRGLSDYWSHGVVAPGPQPTAL
jgi:sporulation protein YlmC with PRC-barrel domain